MGFSLGYFSLGYFGLALALSLSRGRLLDAVGKVLTPLLSLLLGGLAIAVLVAPQGEATHTAAAYLVHPGIQGLLEGYNTMDTFGALMFGMLIINVLREKGIEAGRLQTRYLAYAGLMAATGLALVYVSLFRLGNTAGGLVTAPDNGGVIVASYVGHLFGDVGQWVLGGIVSLACLTTAVGLICACGDFFSGLWPRLGYRRVVVGLCVICALVANVGLAQLIRLSVPVLVAIYPVAVALVLVTFLQGWFAQPRQGVRLVMLVAQLFGSLDGLKAAGLELAALDFLPLFDLGLAWLLPTLAAVLVAGLLPGRGIPLPQGAELE